VSNYLFAYGTLRPGCVPAGIPHVAAKLRVVGEGFVHGVLYDLGGYPGAVPDPKTTGKIAGTVLELPEDANVLRKLDAYEEFDPEAPAASEFVRVRQSVEMSEGGAMECWFYRYNWRPHSARAIEDEEWRR
jgi:gamma-glutamylcyclotransferase (GGCT)/AIG2-like uncharacterized protein YtfP